MLEVSVLDDGKDQFLGSAVITLDDQEEVKLLYFYLHLLCLRTEFMLVIHIKFILNTHRNVSF